MSARPQRTARRRRRQAGYTLIEILTAIGILLVGGVGIFAIEQGAIIANMEARRMATAQHVAATVAERIRRDALSWTVGGASMPSTALDRTAYLVNAGTTPGAAATPWMNLTPATAAESWGFDYWGNDTRVAVDMAYCAQMRFQWVFPGQALRADVRVYYPRRGDGRSDDGNDASAWVGCPNTAADSSALLRDLRFAQVSTVVRWNSGALP
jgi:prepilin-type N-terminal cleavage/methylation domain-containing protein